MTIIQKFCCAFFLISMITQGILSEKIIGQSTQKISSVDSLVHKLVEIHEIPGLALAIIKENKVIHEGYYGFANLEHKVPVSGKTIFRIYSTTKLISATAVFQLIQNGNLQLEDPISLYLRDIPQSWNLVQIKHLLSHSSGLPDLIRLGNDLQGPAIMEALSKMPIEFQPGDRFSYNQTNFWLLTRIIEQITDSSYEANVMDQQFPNQSSGVLFSSNSLSVIDHRATKYEFNYPDFKINPAVNLPLAHSGNGLNITLPAFIEWNRRLDQNQLLSQENKELMWQNFEFNNNKDHFLYGWGLYQVNGHNSVGFTGGGVSGFRKFLGNNLTVIVLTNGYRYFPVHNAIIDQIAGQIDPELKDPLIISKSKLTNAIINQPVEQAINLYRALNRSYPEGSFENTLNRGGYLLAQNNRVQDAIKIFQLNVEEHPKSWNVYDSLGEGYEINGDDKKAIHFYQKSLEINPKNNHAIKKIKRLSNKP